MSQGLALQEKTIKLPGYFLESLGPMKTITHYHKFLFSFNLTEINSKIGSIEKHISKPSDTLTAATDYMLIKEINEARETLSKFDQNRHKRSLAPVLGTIIKFIAGNPDEMDLQEINDNIENLHSNQKQIVEKLSQFTSFAHHISRAFENTTRNLYNTLNKFESETKKLKFAFQEQILLENYLMYLKDVNLNLNKIQRSITYSWKNIVDLELVTQEQLYTIFQHLHLFYKNEQLLHTLLPYDILEISKIIIIGTPGIVNFMLKIPILSSQKSDFYKVLPIPNQRNEVLVPPARYAVKNGINTQWTDEDCSMKNDIYICNEQPMTKKCQFDDLSACVFAKVKNDYKLVYSTKHGLLISGLSDTPIYEQCDAAVNNFVIKNNNLIISNCTLIFNNNLYNAFHTDFLNFTKFDNNLLKYDVKHHVFIEQNYHNSYCLILSDLKEINNHPVYLLPVVHYTHVSITFVLICIITAFVIILCIFRKRLCLLMDRKRKVIVINKSQIKNLQSANEDA